MFDEDLTMPVQVGYTCRVRPEILAKDFKYGRSDFLLEAQRNAYVGTIKTIRSDGDVEVVFHGTACNLPWAFAISELVNDRRVDKPSGGMKYDGDKPRMELLVQGCPNALEQVGTVLTFGAKKYTAHSWQAVPGGDDRYLAALLRHLTAIGKGEESDPESGLSHLAHVACNALFILELECRKKANAV